MLTFDASGIAARGVPVLCIDTCSLIDIMRDPTRPDAHVHMRRAAVELVECLETGTLACLIAGQVDHEFKEHDVPEQENASKALKALGTQIERVNEIHGLFLPPVAIEVRHIEAQVAAARAIIERWFKASSLVSFGSPVLARAFDRMSHHVTPARKGKDSMKDCVVVETYAEAIQMIRDAQSTTPTVFLSSNTKDFCNESRALKPDLAAEFAALNMTYATNMAAAKHLLGL